MLGLAIATIVWSMKVMATAKSIAARARFLDFALVRGPGVPGAAGAVMKRPLVGRTAAGGSRPRNQGNRPGPHVHSGAVMRSADDRMALRALAGDLSCRLPK